MGHVPHLYLPGAWDGPEVAVGEGARHHLDRVLRVRATTAVTYTDGCGTFGEGTYGDGVVRRGVERSSRSRSPRLTIACAPPDAMNRQRFLVEKLAELGVHELIWLDTMRSQGRPARASKAAAWAVGALEQSHGSHLLAIGGPQRVEDLAAPVLIADPSGEQNWWPVDDVTIVIGPEGGLADDEVPASSKRVSLGPTILRVETAALVAAVLALNVPDGDQARHGTL